MTRAVKGQVIDKTFCFPFRMILAGSSGAGKTYFARQLLKNDLFEKKVSAVHYYFPCYLTESPVDWHKTLNVPVSYHLGLPSKTDLMQLEKNCCVVIDDSFDEALKSSAIDHLFRVISGKRQICVMIMTQNNFSKGKYGREIRNSCNFSVLFRNCCDVSINENIARMAGMKKAYDSAYLDLQGQRYPYMLLDQSQKGQLSPYRLYTNIFDRFSNAYSVDGMKAYVIGAQDFELFFDIFSNGDKFSANESSKQERSGRSGKSTKSGVEKKQKKDKPSEVRETENDSECSEDRGPSEQSEQIVSSNTDQSFQKAEEGTESRSETRRLKRSASQREANRARRRFERTLY